MSRTPPPAILEVEGLTKSFRSGAGALEVLHAVSFRPSAPRSRRWRQSRC